MNVTVRKVSDEVTVIEVQTNSGIKDLIVKKVEHGFSYNNFEDWDISDDNYYDLEDLVEKTMEKMNKKQSSLKIRFE